MSTCKQVLLLQRYPLPNLRLKETRNLLKAAWETQKTTTIMLFPGFRKAAGSLHTLTSDRGEPKGVSRRTEMHSPLRLSSSIGTIVAGGPVLANLQSIKIKKKKLFLIPEKGPWVFVCLLVLWVVCFSKQVTIFSILKTSITEV